MKALVHADCKMLKNKSGNDVFFVIVTQRIHLKCGGWDIHRDFYIGCSSINVVIGAYVTS